MPLARISLTLSRHFSLRSSGLYPVSSHSCWSSCFCSVICGGPWEYLTYELVLLLQQCPACLVRLTWIVFVMGGRWPCRVLLPGLVQYCSQHFCVIGEISTLDGTSLKLVDKFTYQGSSVSSTEKDIDTRLTKAWTAIDRLSIIWKSDLTDKMKRSFFLAAVVSILLYGCTTWTLTKRLEKKLYRYIRYIYV